MLPSRGQRFLRSLLLFARMSSRWVSGCVVVGSLSIGSGCISLVSDGKVGDREVRLDGTGVAWLDETAYEGALDGVQLTERDSDNVILHLLFTSAVFDPSVDHRSLPWAERQRLYDELRRGDLLRLFVRRGDRLVAGDVLEYSSTEDHIPEAAPYLWYTQLQLGSPDLPPDATYPETLEQPARDLHVTLQLNEVTPRLLGEVSVRVRRQEADPGAEGDIDVSFNVERVPERIAECNFAPDGAGGGVDPCAGLSLTE